MQLYLRPCPSYGLPVLHGPLYSLILWVKFNEFKYKFRSFQKDFRGLITEQLLLQGVVLLSCTFVPQTRERDVGCLIAVMISNPLLLPERFSRVLQSVSQNLLKIQPFIAGFGWVMFQGKKCHPVWIYHVSKRENVPIDRWIDKKSLRFLRNNQDFSIISIYLTAKFTCEARAESKQLQHNLKNTEVSGAVE